jgi:leucyl-tRNA synthetase
MQFPAGSSNEAIQEAALSDPQAQKYLDGFNVVKVIVVPNKIVNIVLKPKA